MSTSGIIKRESRKCDWFEKGLLAGGPRLTNLWKADVRDARRNAHRDEVGLLSDSISSQQSLYSISVGKQQRGRRSPQPQNEKKKRRLTFQVARKRAGGEGKGDKGKGGGGGSIS